MKNNKKAVKAGEKKKEQRGLYRADSNVGRLFALLSGGKPAGQKEMAKTLDSSKTLARRLRQLKRHGKRGNRWVIEDLGHGQVRMRFTSAGAKEAALAGAKPSGKDAAAPPAAAKKSDKKGGAAKAGKKSTDSRKWRDE